MSFALSVLVFFLICQFLTHSSTCSRSNSAKISTTIYSLVQSIFVCFFYDSSKFTLGLGCFILPLVNIFCIFHNFNLHNQSEKKNSFTYYHCSALLKLKLIISLNWLALIRSNVLTCVMLGFVTSLNRYVCITLILSFILDYLSFPKRVAIRCSFFNNFAVLQCTFSVRWFNRFSIRVFLHKFYQGRKWRWTEKNSFVVPLSSRISSA